MTSLFDPTGYAWHLQALFHGLAGLLIIIMGLFTVGREWGTRVGRLYLLYTFSISSWVLSLAMVMLSMDSAHALTWTRLGNAGIAFLPAIFFHITTVLLNLKHIRPGYIYLLWAISTGFAFAALLNSDFVTGMQTYGWGLYGKYGILGTLFLIYFSTLILSTIVCYFMNSRQTRQGSNLQKRATLLFRSFLIGLFGAIDFLPAYGIDIFPVGVVFLLPLFAISTYVTWRYRLVDITAEYAADNIIKLINSPLIVVDLDGDIRLTNDAADRLFSIIDRQSLIDKMLLLADDKPSNQALKQNATVEHLEFSFDVLDHQHFFSLSVSPLLSPQKTLIAYLFLLRDISSTKQSEALLKQARDDLEKNVMERTQQLQKEMETHKQTAEALLTAKNIAETASQAKTEFLSRISHELRTPLNALLGFTQLLQLDREDFENPEHRQYIEQMLKSGEKLHELIENILDLSRLDMGNLDVSIETIELVPVIQEGLQLIQQLAKARNIAIENRTEKTESCKVMADRKRVKQIILNLAINAVKYNRDNGKIIIDCQNTDEKCTISVTDTGVGISPEDQVKVFEPFERLDDWRHHTDGAGIGLTLSRRLAHEMKGDLNFTSEPGVGSRFCLELPTSK